MTRTSLRICILIGCTVLSFRESCPAPPAMKVGWETSGPVTGIHMQIRQRDLAETKVEHGFAVCFSDFLHTAITQSATQK